MKNGGDTVDFDGERRYRAIFVSDIHLGTKACQADAFLDFLRYCDTPRIYLVGDIVDFWRIKRGVYWPQAIMTCCRNFCAKPAKAPSSF